MPSFLTLWVYLQNVQTPTKNEDGLVAVEYAVLGGIIVGIIVFVMIAFRLALIDKFAAILP